MYYGNYPDDPDTEVMLDACYEYVKGDAWQFIASLKDSYDEYGELTDAQYEALRKFYYRLSPVQRG